ncbi:lasso RiPP family leader peptide-containing protein [Streptomyces sp. NBC_00868]|nr:lasso RiPP family leader peptide-containing protein [Streptomyces sp. NBC_00868]
MTTETSYETPMLAEIGDFADVTRATYRGFWVDFFGGWWF